MDIKGKIDEIVAKFKDDPELMKQFQTEPVKAIEKVIGVDLPDDMIENVITAVKSKITMDSLSGALDSLKKLF